MEVEIRDKDMLKCPYCGEIYLHQGKVEVFELVKEDDNEGNITTIDGMDTSVKYGRLCGNPSMRRNGLLIHFECETCDNTPVLRISQHKGLTLIDWK
jgi:hypothetical protein